MIDLERTKLDRDNEQYRAFNECNFCDRSPIEVRLALNIFIGKLNAVLGKGNKLYTRVYVSNTS